jgi:hypothetical protein
MAVSAQSGTKSPVAPQHRDPIGLRVTDTKGNVVTLLFQNRGVEIDYTTYGFMYRTDYESDGVRIRQGEGQLTVRWMKLLRIDVTKVTDAGAEGQMVTAAGDTQPVVLVPWSKEGLMGEAELGRFSINLDKVKTIEVIR